MHLGSIALPIPTGQGQQLCGAYPTLAGIAGQIRDSRERYLLQIRTSDHDGIGRSVLDLKRMLKQIGCQQIALTQDPYELLHVKFHAHIWHQILCHAEVLETDGKLGQELYLRSDQQALTLRLVRRYLLALAPYSVRLIKNDRSEPIAQALEQVLVAIRWLEDQPLGDSKDKFQRAMAQAHALREVLELAVCVAISSQAIEWVASNPTVRQALQLILDSPDKRVCQSELAQKTGLQITDLCALETEELVVRQFIPSGMFLKAGPKSEATMAAAKMYLGQLVC